MNDDFLYLKWYDYKTEKKYILGILYKKNDMYYFKLSDFQYDEAIKNGYSGILPFTKKGEIYSSKSLFNVFKKRLPNIENLTKEQQKIILDEYGMKEYSEFEYLKKSKGVVATDNLILEDNKDGEI